MTKIRSMIATEQDLANVESPDGSVVANNENAKNLIDQRVHKENTNTILTELDIPNTPVCPESTFFDSLNTLLLEAEGSFIKNTKNMFEAMKGFDPQDFCKEI